MSGIGEGAGLLGKSAGVLARQGLELTVLKEVAAFTGTGTNITTRGGLELTYHVAAERLASKEVLNLGRRAATMEELDVLYETGTQLPNKGGTIKIVRPDLDKILYMIVTKGNQISPPRVITVVIPKGTPPITPP